MTIILLESRPHYILSTTGEKSYILGEKPSGNRHFVIFNRETQSHYTIYVVDLEKTVEAMPSE
ncbi:MAG: hypothetical protein SOS93_00750 [Mannheimia varigena]|nr:hypothetical protein [Mannheimia varigena]